MLVCVGYWYLRAWRVVDCVSSCWGERYDRGRQLYGVGRVSRSSVCEQRGRDGQRRIQNLPGMDLAGESLCVSVSESLREGAGHPPALERTRRYDTIPCMSSQA